MRKLDEEKKVLVISLIVTMIIYIILFPLYFFSYIGIPSGFLFGSVIGLISYWTFIVQADRVLESQKPTAFVPYLFVRLGLAIFGIALPLVLKEYALPILDVFAVFVGYFPTRIVSMILKRKESIKK